MKINENELLCRECEWIGKHSEALKAPNPSKKIIFYGDTSPVLTISWEGGKVSVEYENINEAGEKFFDFLKTYIEAEYEIKERR